MKRGYAGIMRKSYDTAFKVKVALEAAKEQMTLQELAQKYDVAPGQISQWKKQLVEGAGQLFERPNKKRKQERETEEERDHLLKTVGQLTVENEFLKKKYRQVYGSDPA
jgi:transposase